MIFFEIYLMLTPIGISGGRLRSDLGERQAGEEAPLLAPERGPKKIN